MIVEMIDCRNDRHSVKQNKRRNLRVREKKKRRVTMIENVVRFADFAQFFWSFLRPFLRGFAFLTRCKDANGSKIFFLFLFFFTEWVTLFCILNTVHCSMNKRILFYHACYKEQSSCHHKLIELIESALMEFHHETDPDNLTDML